MRCSTVTVRPGNESRACLAEATGQASMGAHVLLTAALAASSATQLDKPALCICSARARLHRLPVRVADLLLNFVVANWTAHSEAGPQAPVQLMRPRRRLDLSRLSGVGEPVAGVAGVAWPCSCAAGSTLAYC